MDQRRIFRLVSEDTNETLVSMAGIEGFFVDPWNVSDVVRLIGTDWGCSRLPLTRSDMELQVIDARSEVIGTYYIGRVKIIKERSDFSASAMTDLEASFFELSVPFRDAEPIWRRWASARPIESYEWEGWPQTCWPSWLHVTQCAWFTSGHSATRYTAKSEYTLDGSRLFNVAAFYLGLGESINGPGGYFGSNLDALEDCLVAQCGKNSRFKMLWTDFSLSVTRLGRSRIDEILCVLQKNGVEVLQR